MGLNTSDVPYKEPGLIFCSEWEITWDAMSEEPDGLLFQAYSMTWNPKTAEL